MNSMQRLVDADAITRLRDHDASLFSTDPEVQARVAERLGWTTLAAEATDLIPRLETLADLLLDGEVHDIGLLGMGGSSLAALVLSTVIGSAPGRPSLHVLDTTSPRTVMDVQATLDMASAGWLVSSKSGSTIEPNALYSVFREEADEILGREGAGGRFVAVTDPGSSLEALAADEGFAATVLAPSAVGGRYSALSAFGLVPAALIGVDITRLVDKARYVEDTVSTVPAAGNPAAQLAAFIADSAFEGRDKLTLVMPARLRSFGLWVEQLIAESLGKRGIGVVPVIELADEPAVATYSPDRAIAIVRTHEDEAWAERIVAEAGNAPIHVTVLGDAYDLGAAFVTWEWATALAGFLLGVNPFDEPDVAAAKQATSEMLAGELEADEDRVLVEGIGLSFSGRSIAPEMPQGLVPALQAALSAADVGDYLAILAYVPEDPPVFQPLVEAVAEVTRRTGKPMCLELGPRYLHSTGQLHKGGPNTGVFVVLSTDDDADVPVASEGWTLRDLHRAQSSGDIATLAGRDRRVLSVVLPDASTQSVQRFAGALKEAAT